MALFLFFAFGFVGAAFALVLELLAASFLIDPSISFRATFIPTPFSLFLFAGIEESIKILLFYRAQKRLASLSPFLPAGLVFGAGFASLEYFILTFLETLPSGPVYGIFLVHIFTAIIIAWALTKYPTRRGFLVLFALVTLLHFGYNMAL